MPRPVLGIDSREGFESSMNDMELFTFRVLFELLDPVLFFVTVQGLSRSRL